ncbi:MAG: SulP family inorganic anion transporter, partial [Actinobacteria bacterium]|nr:SulP family inorganic anion transporter [Actinomycetota bacterium]
MTRPVRPGRAHRLILPTLRNYQAGWLGADVLAGLTLMAIAVPEQMATSRLAGMPPAAGLYAFLAGSLVFVLLGRSAHLSVGADSTIAPVMAGGVAALGVSGTARYG